MRFGQGRERSLSTQAISLALATGAGQVLIAFVYILAARNSRAAEFGLVVTAIALGMAFVGFVDFGTNLYWVRETARLKMSRQDFGQRLVSKLIIAGVVSVSWAALSLLWLPETMLWVAAPVGMALLVNQSNQVVLRGTARAQAVSLSILADRTVVIVCFLTSLALGAVPTSALWISLTAGSAVAACVGWKLTPVGSRPILSWRPRTNPWKGAGHYGLFTLGVSAANLDLPLLTALAGPAASGLYGAVNRWTQPMNLLAGAFSSASVPFVARSTSWAQAWRLVTKALWLPITAICGSIFVALAAPFIVSTLIGDSYAGSVPVLQLLALACIPMIVNQPLSVFLQAMGYDRVVARANILAIVMQLLLVASLAVVWGAVGAAVSLLATQAFLSVFLMAFVSMCAAKSPLSRPEQHELAGSQ